MNKWIYLLSAIILTGLLSGCASGVKIKEANHTIEEIRNAIFVVAGQVRNGDQWGRSFDSPYFPPRPNPNFNPAKSNERAFARFIITGDRRPYQIIVQVFIEKRRGADYALEFEDEVWANRVVEDLRRALTKGREDRSKIDSFRPF